MRVNPISVYGSSLRKFSVKTRETESTPIEKPVNFKGGTGSVLGGIAGFALGAATLAIFGGPAIIAGAMAVAGSKWGSDQEDNYKRINNSKK